MYLHCLCKKSMCWILDHFTSHICLFDHKSWLIGVIQNIILCR